MSSLRTFVALDVSAAVRDQVGRLVGLLKKSGADVKWIEAPHVHLTLNFLGNVPESQIPEVCQQVAQACGLAAPFEIACGGAGAFPNVARPRTLWLGIRDGSEQLVDLQAVLEAALSEIGFPPESRRFHPHVTIGRVKRAGRESADLARLLREHESFDAGRSEVDAVTVYSSHLDRTGPTHTALARIEL